MDIAKRILDLCSEFNITPNKAASLADMSYSTLHDIVAERNKSPQISTIEKICDGLGITLSYFFTVDPELPPEAIKELKQFENYLRWKYHTPANLENQPPE